MLFGLAVITMPISVWPGNSFDALTGWYWKLVLLFFLVLYWCRSRQDLNRIMWACCISLCWFVVQGVFTGEIEAARFHAKSNSYDSNDLAMLLVMALPLAQYLYSSSRTVPRLVLIGIVLTFLYGIVLSQSRGGFLALLVVGALMVWRSTLSAKSKVALGLTALLVFGVLAGPAYWERIGTIWNPTTEYDRTAGGRTVLWKTGLVILATHPWGIGIDGFETAEGLSHEGEGK